MSDTISNAKVVQIDVGNAGRDSVAKIGIYNKNFITSIWLSLTNVKVGLHKVLPKHLLVDNHLVMNNYLLTVRFSVVFRG